MQVTQFNTPWGGIGTALENKTDIAEAIRKAKMDWTVSKTPLYANIGGEFVETKTFGMVRSDTGKLITNTRAVGPNYVPLQNEKAFEFFQPFLESGDVELETAGVLSGGAKVWVLAKILRDPIVISKEDEVLKYLLLSNSHDGSSAIRIGFSPIRVVCSNTLAAAIRHDASRLMRIRHNKSTTTNLENIRQTIDAVDRVFVAHGKLYKALNNKGINQNDVKEYVKRVFNFEEKERKGEVKLSTRSENIINDISLLHKQRLEQIDANIQAGRGAGPNPTVWSLYNSANEYLNHQRGRSVDSRLTSLWFGEGANLNEKALLIACEMADVNPDAFVTDVAV